jgi:hypothetical protein
VLQFLLGLSDRQAAEAVRCRIDFKHALAMELDDPGSHHSVLADFRERIAQDDRADRLLGLALARLKEAGLVRERTTQRSDSPHIPAAARDPTRLELLTEAVRAAPEDVARTAGHLLRDLVAAVRHAVTLPVIAALGNATAADVTAALRAGTVAAMVGTVLLRTQESGPDRGSGRCCGLWLPPTAAARWDWSRTGPGRAGGALRLERPSLFGSRPVVAPCAIRSEPPSSGILIL